jgi:4-hydroxythreonine-4-phosphate dehydrogenase
MGDPAGIGPETILKALAGSGTGEWCRPAVLGDPVLLAGVAARLGLPLRVVTVDAPGGELEAGQIPVIDCCRLPWSGPRFGQATPEGGRAAADCIREGVRLCLEGKADALVTAPINKAAFRRGGSPYPGHTEMLAHLTGTADYAMMLAGGGLRVSLVTIHEPLASVPALVTRERVRGVIRLTHRAVERLEGPGGRIAVCGLNPHAGEGGLFGAEERESIAPAVEDARGEGIAAEGPLPADTVFHRARRGDFAAVVAMYHDQGLGPLKTVGFDEGVNVTLGLPLVRTSPDHGTAYDIAGRGIASPRSLLEAMRLAARLAGGSGE